MRATSPRESRTSVRALLRAGSTPIDSSPLRGSRAGVVVYVRRSFPRFTSMVSSVSGLAMAAATRRSTKVLVSSPSIATTSSPGCSPTGLVGSDGAAVAAGEPGTTKPTVAAGNRTPARNATRNSTIASPRFAVMPARITTARFGIGALEKLRASSLVASGLPSSWPSMRTYPPSGSARSEYSVSPSPCRSRSASDISIGRLPCRRTTLASAAPKQNPTPRR